MPVVPAAGPEVEAPPPDRPVPRLRRGEFATAAWGLALLVCMFAVKWYGVDNVPGRAKSVVTAVDAWNGLSVVRWLMLAMIVFAVASVALHISQGDHGSQTDTSRVLAWGTTLMAALLVYRVLIALPSANAVVDQKLGALIGLGCALAMTASAWQARRASVAAARAPVVHRRRRRPGTRAGDRGQVEVGPGAAGETVPTPADSAPAARATDPVRTPRPTSP